ncbi:hypothetical protein [Actinophytocola sp.]|uniref:hypothetical protein n=1 Tax=Actinophytocola sp. TaxID=1872138 RepID=UPI0025C416D2|nr:hypothetical protein [Actinophytocola sp.]
MTVGVHLARMDTDTKLHLRDLAGDLIVPTQADMNPVDQRRHEHSRANMRRDNHDNTVAAILAVVVVGRHVAGGETFMQQVIQRVAQILSHVIAAALIAERGDVDGQEPALSGRRPLL